MIRVPSETLGVGLVFVAIGVLACLSPAQSDTWWMIRAGQDIWTTGAIPYGDAYSHTASGRFWFNHQWLSELIFFAAFRLGGLPLLTGLCASAILAAWILCWRLTRGAFEWRFVLLAVCMPAAAGSWALRAQVFSTLLFVLVCRALAEKRRLVWIPAIVALWVNVHAGVVLGLVAIAGAALAETVHRRQIAWPLVWTLGASALATGLSPLGVRLYPEILLSIERSRINRLSEWLPPDAALWLWPFWGLVAAVPVTIVVRRRVFDERTARWLGIALAVLPLAVRSTRNVHIFLLAAVPAVTSAWARLAPGRARAAGEREGVNGAILSVASVLAAVLVAAIWMRPPPALGWRPISPAAVAAIEACDGRLYNTYSDGGVLIWFAPGTRVFIDNRQDPYPNELLRESKQLESDGLYESVFARYLIRCAAVPAIHPVTRRLLVDPQWSVIHRDASWIVMRRAGPP